VAALAAVRAALADWSADVADIVRALSAPTSRWRSSSLSTDDRLTLASVSDCGSADVVVRHDRWSSIPGV
jgi:hypothetical protein